VRGVALAQANERYAKAKQASQHGTVRMGAGTHQRARQDDLTMPRRQDFAKFSAKWMTRMVDINGCKANLFEKEYFDGPQSVSGKRDLHDHRRQTLPSVQP
jgi:hypothetical protein